MKRYRFYPISNYLEPIPSMVELAKELGVTKATLSAYKIRRKCIGKLTKPIYKWFYVVDDTFTNEELNSLAESACAKLNNEHWRPLFDGYHISNYGRIKSNKYKKEIIMRQVVRSNKQRKELGVKLRVDGANKMFFTRQLVANAFIEKEDRSHLKSVPQQKYVFKKVNDPLNNFADNLKWCDINDMRRAGRDNGAGIPVIKCDPVTNEELEHYTSQGEAGRDSYIASQAISYARLHGSCISGGYLWKIDEEWLQATQ